MLVSSNGRVGAGLSARGDGPDRGRECLPCQPFGEFGDGAAGRVRQRAAVDGGVSGSGESMRDWRYLYV